MRKLIFVPNSIDINELLIIIENNLFGDVQIDVVTFYASIDQFLRNKFHSAIRIELIHKKHDYQNYVYTSFLIEEFSYLFSKTSYDEVLVFGGAIEGFSMALAAFYKKIPISYLLSWANKFSLNLFEEKFLRLTAALASRYFYVHSETRKIQGVNKDTFFQSFIHDSFPSVKPTLYFRNVPEVLIVIGTRPEAIKMYPVIQELSKIKSIKLSVCDSGQHKDIINEILDFFSIKINYRVELPKGSRDLFQIFNSILTGLGKILERKRFDYIFVHGDTSTALVASLAAYFYNIPIVHVESGLRTKDIYSPFPEEINRRFISILADLHFAPVVRCADNLALEGISKKDIFVTGNTVIDPLLRVISLLRKNSSGYIDKLSHHFNYLNHTKRLILVTAHRRENIEQGLMNIYIAIRKLASRDDVQIVYPVHMNPYIHMLAHKMLGNITNVYLIEPQNYLAFVYLLTRSYIVMTDSGGMQEELAGLKPIMVLRNNTERPEAVNSGAAILVGANSDRIVYYANKLLNDLSFYHTMINLSNPYGDGFAGQRIAERFIRITKERYYSNGTATSVSRVSRDNYDRLISTESNTDVQDQQFEVVKQQLSPTKIMYDNLVFQGGGIKGVMYIGALLELEKVLGLDKIKRVAGTSAGAFVAVLFALGIVPKEISVSLINLTRISEQENIQLLKEIEAIGQIFFLGVFFDKVFNYLRNKAFYNQQGSKFYNLKIEDFFDSSLKQNAADIFKKIYAGEGLSTGEILRESIDNTIAKKIGKKHATFQEWREYLGKHKKKCKHIYLVCTELTKDGLKPRTFSSEDSNSNDFIISDVVRASTSTPMLFTAHKLYRKSVSGIRYPESNRIYVDGGVISNNPLMSIFDQGKYQPGLGANENSTLKFFNRQTLSFNLMMPRVATEIVEPRAVNNFYEIVKLILYYFYSTEHTDVGDPHRVINLDDFRISGLDFNISAADKALLIETGSRAVKAFFAKTDDLMTKPFIENLRNGETNKIPLTLDFLEKSAEAFQPNSVSIISDPKQNAIPGIEPKSITPQTSAGSQCAIPTWFSPTKYLAKKTAAVVTAGYQAVHGLFSQPQANPSFDASAIQTSIIASQDPLVIQIVNNMNVTGVVTQSALALTLWQMVKSVAQFFNGETAENRAETELQEIEVTKQRKRWVEAYGKNPYAAIYFKLTPADLDTQEDINHALTKLRQRELMRLASLCWDEKVLRDTSFKKLPTELRENILDYAEEAYTFILKIYSISLPPMLAIDEEADSSLTSETISSCGQEESSYSAQWATLFATKKLHLIDTVSTSFSPTLSKASELVNITMK